MTTQTHSDDPLTPELRAAEYVLGTLEAAERAQVEKDMAYDADLAREVTYWEDRLGPLSLLDTAVEPPVDVWAQIQARTQPVANESRGPGTGLWVGLTIAASMAAFALASLMFVGLQPDPGTTAMNDGGTNEAEQASLPVEPSAPIYASLIEDPKRDLAWLVTADSAPVQQLQIVAMGDSYDKTWADRSLELWLLAPGEQPVSLALLPKEGVSNVPVSKDLATMMAQSDTGSGATQLAVSNEPLGGSPTGAPTGEVLFVVALNQRKSY